MSQLALKLNRSLITDKTIVLRNMSLSKSLEKIDSDFQKKIHKKHLQIKQISKNSFPKKKAFDVSKFDTQITQVPTLVTKTIYWTRWPWMWWEKGVGGGQQG